VALSRMASKQGVRGRGISSLILPRLITSWSLLSLAESAIHDRLGGTLWINTAGKSQTLSSAAHSRDSLAHNDELPFAAATNWPDGQITKNLSSPFCKKISVFSWPKSSLYSALSRALLEGRIAIVTDVGREMRWTLMCRRRTALMRTAKSCGPDAPMLASSFAAPIVLAPTFCWWQVRLANAPTEYNVSVPDMVHVNLVPASFSIQSLQRAIYRNFNSETNLS
jgi:hypothetical protein